MHLTKLKECDNLKIISDSLKKNQEELSKEILNFLYVNEMTEDGSMDYGKTIKQIIDEYNGLTSPIAITTLCLKTNNPKIVEAFENLTIIGLDDCPDCGDELEKFGEGNYGKTWEVERCSCGYYHSTEPDWDEAYEDA